MILAVDYRESPDQIEFFNRDFDLKFPLLVSMGQEGDPSFMRASQDPRPVAYFRYDTTQKWPPLAYGA